MTASTEASLKRALFWVATTTAVYLLMNGAQLFETLLIVPAWTAAPPASLGMFQGEYRLDFKNFWIAFHSIHEVTFILAIIFAWPIRSVRYWLLALFVVHFAVRAWTLAYFAPTIIGFQSIPPSPSIDPALVESAARWRSLNIVRVALFMAVNFAMFPLIIRIANRLCSAQQPGRLQPVVGPVAERLDRDRV